MKTTPELLEEAKNNLPKFGYKPSYYRLALELEITETRLANYRKRGTVWPDEIMRKCMKFLPYSEEQLLFWARMERETDSVLLKAYRKIDPLLDRRNADQCILCKISKYSYMSQTAAS